MNEIKFFFKKNLEDFVVHEQLPFHPDWVGDFFYTLIEKRGINTMDIVENICKNFNLERKQVGIAGLKDKDGITQQRISLSKKYLNRIWWEFEFLTFLGNFWKIVCSWRHNEPLIIGRNSWNRFFIRLRANCIIEDQLKTTIEQRLKQISLRGFPNAYWIQRFGKWNKNFKKALQIFSWETDFFKKTESYEVKFKLQAFWSMWFNIYVMERLKQGLFLLDGDVMVNGWNAFWTDVAYYQQGKLSHFDYWKEKEHHAWEATWNPWGSLWESDFNNKTWFPTWMVLGKELILCKTGTVARAFDDKILEESWFLFNGAKISSRYHLYWFRRPLWAYPWDLRRVWDSNDLLLEFFLPTGCYASVFLAYLLKEIDPEGCKQNGLIIPLIQ